MFNKIIIIKLLLLLFFPNSNLFKVLGVKEKKLMSCLTIILLSIFLLDSSLVIKIHFLLHFLTPI